MPFVHDCNGNFCLPQIWNVHHTCNNEDQVRWPVISEVVNVPFQIFCTSATLVTNFWRHTVGVTNILSGCNIYICYSWQVQVQLQKFYKRKSLPHSNTDTYTPILKSFILITFIQLIYSKESVYIHIFKRVLLFSLNSNRLPTI